MSLRPGSARVDYTRKDRLLQVTVPKGFTYQKAPALLERSLAAELLEKLRHEHPGCLSGIPVLIKEEFENEVTVDLER